jgi:hypothetical protein
MIRLPSPTTMENYVRWARQLISTLELQQRTNELTTSYYKRSRRKRRSKELV